MAVLSPEEYVEKCRNKFPFFCYKEVKIRPKRGGTLIPLELNRPQRHVQTIKRRLAQRHRPLRLLILKARQWGSSTLCQAEICHANRFKENHVAMVIGDREKTTKWLVQMNRLMHDNLSDAVKAGWKRTKSRSDSYYEWENGSILQIDTAGATDPGRGVTASYLHGSEVASWPDGGAVLDAMLPGITAGHGSEHRSVVLETTSKGANGVFWELWEGADSVWSEWERIFIPWTMHDEYTVALPKRLLRLWEKFVAGDQDALRLIPHLDELEREWLINGTMDLAQVHWRKTRIASDFKGREESFAREFPLTVEDAFAGTTADFLVGDAEKMQFGGMLEMKGYEVLLPQKPLVMVEDDERPAPVESKKGWIWASKPPEEDVQYVIGVDPAEGLGKDYSAFVVRARGEVVCVGQQDKMSTDNFAEVLWCVGRWFNWATLNVERGGGGLAVLNMLARLNYPRLYQTDQLEQSMPNADGSFGGSKFGFVPTRANVAAIMAMLRHSANTGSLMLRFERLIHECKWLRLVEQSTPDGMTYKWVCPSKGRQYTSKAKISDDMLRACALTEVVARDDEWVKESTASDFVTAKVSEHVVTSGTEDYSLHNPLFTDEEQLVLFEVDPKTQRIEYDIEILSPFDESVDDVVLGG